MRLAIMLAVVGSGNLFLLGCTRPPANESSLNQHKAPVTKEFVAMKGDFKVQIPIAAQIQAKEPAKGVLAHYFLMHDGAYGVTCVDLPEPVDTSAEGVKQSLEFGVEEIAAKAPTPMKVITQKDMKLHDKYHGREVVAAAADGSQFIRYRFFFVGQRMYQITAIGKSKTFSNSADVTEFLDSFTLLE